jgi:hypothetical protein
MILPILIFFTLTSSSYAHELWINKERRTNDKGEWCCNSNDCKPVNEDNIQVSDHGYTVHIGQRFYFVPHHQAQESGDLQFWACVYPGARGMKCFFFPRRIT